MFNAGEADHSPTSFSGKRKIFQAGKFLIGREGKCPRGWEDVGKMKLPSLSYVLKLPK